jgi:adenylate cyclase, class 2
MINTIEIELRYQILNESTIPGFVKTLAFLGTKRVVDSYLDTINADLIRRGIYIRLRNNQKLDIKFNRACLADESLELQPYCEEYSFSLPLMQESLHDLNAVSLDLELQPINRASIKEYASINKLIEHRIVDKIRSSYSIEDFILVIDEVKNLGKFLEIEVMAPDIDNIDTIKLRMQELLKDLKLKPLTTGYDALILRKQNFKQYLQARFILAEDKIYV